MLSTVMLLMFQSLAPPRDLASVLSPVLRASGVPALGAAVVSSRGLEAIGAVGVRRWGAADTVSADDQWHIGSCTKAITATLVARLADRGVVGWETTIGSVFRGTIDPGWRDVSLLWLLSHRAGAPGDLDEASWQQMVRRGGSPKRQRRWFVERLLSRPPASRPNTSTVYSNAGYLIAGVMLEIVTGRAWEDLVRHDVFDPLGMTRTGFGAPGTPGRLDQPLGHVRGPDGWVPVLRGPRDDNPAATGPAGTVHTTLADWARFVAAHLRGENGDQTFLSRAAWRRLHAPGGEGWGYTPGWVVGDEPWAGGAYLHHLGSNNFWLAEATLLPGKDLAVLLVTNVADDAVETPFKTLLSSLVAESGSPRSGQR